MQLISLLGQTSSGKSDMAIELSRFLVSKNNRFCVIGCDSRQIYKGLDIGTGKVEGKWQFDNELKENVYIYKGVVHFLIDFIDPTFDYNLNNYVLDFYNLAIRIEQKFDFAILVGGTGLYAKTILEKTNIGTIKLQFESQYNQYKKELQSLDLQQLQEQVNTNQILLNGSDYNNKIRLVSNLLRIKANSQNWLEPTKYYNFTQQYSFAIQADQLELKTKIKNRLQQRFEQGLIQEIKKFEYLGVKKIVALGLEYRQTWFYLQGQLSTEELQQKLLNVNIQYAKRQLTWLKKQNLIWINSLQEIVEQIKFENH